MTREGTVALATRGTDPVLLCTHGADLIALSLRYVKQVASARSLARVPGAPRFVLGLSLVHGRLVTVVDVGEVAGGPPAPPRELTKGRVVLVDEGRGEIGLWVRRVLRVVPVSPGSLEAPGSWAGAHVSAFFRTPPDNRVATLLALEHVLGPFA